MPSELARRIAERIENDTLPTAAIIDAELEAVRKALECQKCYCAYATHPQYMSAAAIESGAESELMQQCARCATLALLEVQA